MRQPSRGSAGLGRGKVPDDDLLSHGQSTLASACRRFTVLFGMGRGGASRLWSSGFEGAASRVGAAAEGKDARDAMSRVPMWVGVSCFVWRLIHAYGVKPHGPLVPVSSRHCCPSTPGLSTWWSATTLQGSQAPGRSHLQASFPLRCFQRLSLPYIATRRCDCRHNRYTSGKSTPVLSY